MNTILQQPCDNIINAKEFFRTEAWVIERKDDEKAITAVSIDNESYPGFIRVINIMSNEVVLIPVHTIDIVKRRDIVGISFNCPMSNSRTKRTDWYVCFYDIPCQCSYKIEKYGLKPFKWYNIDSMEEAKEIKERLENVCR